MRIEKVTLSTSKQTYKISAAYGKVLMRIADGQVFGEELILGYIYYLGSQKLVDDDGKPNPHWEVPEDYTEVDKPEEVEEPIDKQEQEEILNEIERAKKEKIKALMAYDSSAAVNEFFYGNTDMWVALEKRVGLSKAVNDHEFLGLPEMTYTMDDGTQLTLPLTKWKYLLATVEIYAQECYNVTASHAANIKRLSGVEQVMEYDFTQGYPEKVHFEIESDEEA